MGGTDERMFRVPPDGLGNGKMRYGISRSAGTDVRQFRGPPDPRGADAISSGVWVVQGLAGTEEISFRVPPDGE